LSALNGPTGRHDDGTTITKDPESVFVNVVVFVVFVVFVNAVGALMLTQMNSGVNRRTNQKDTS
jgi:hypothetical protein